MDKGKFNICTFLFPTSSFILGVGSIMNIAGGYYDYNSSETPIDADFKALKSDWLVVGKDIKSSIENFKEDHKSQLEPAFDLDK